MGRPGRVVKEGLSRQPEKSQRRPPKITPRIEQFITEWTREFHDEESLRSNLSQAAKLWERSGLPEAAFCQILGEARLVTKQQGNIHKRAGGEAGRMGLRNRMPFFFVVARDLLGLKETSRGRSK